ncbi:hypothetical protein WK25_19205 [Burkholderia latens]|nr:hypothetical protein WK25_19205 [Burkholderia latens]
MNQGKKPCAHRSAPLKTHDRRKLPGVCSTMCGATPPARPGRHASPSCTAPGPPAGKRRRCRDFIVVTFAQQALSD